MPADRRRPTSVVLVALTVLPLLAATVLALTLGRARPAADAVSDGADGWDARRTATLVGDTLGSWADLTRLAVHNDQVQDLFRHPGNADALRRPVESFLVGLASVVGGDGTRVAVLTADGELVAEVSGGRSSSDGRVGVDLAEDPTVTQALALAAGRVMQYPPRVSPQSRTWVVTTATRVMMGDRPAGVLLVDVELGRLREVLSAAVPEGVRARVVDDTTQTLVADTGREAPEADPARSPDMQWLPRAGRLDIDRGAQVDSTPVDLAGTAIGVWRADTVLTRAEPSTAPFLLAVAALVLGSGVVAHRLGQDRPVPVAGEEPEAGPGDIVASASPQAHQEAPHHDEQAEPGDGEGGQEEPASSDVVPRPRSGVIPGPRSAPRTSRGGRILRRGRV